MSPINRQDFNDRIMEINSLKTELERTKKDKNITSGLVSQMQRDMSNKVGPMIASYHCVALVFLFIYC